MKSEEICYTCEFFVQHFALEHDPNGAMFRLIEICCGHCRKPRLKQRKPDTPACEHYQPKEPTYL